MNPKRKNFQSKDVISISTNKSKLDLNFIYNYLTHSYWSPGISKQKVVLGIKNSLCFGVYKNKKQIGFARVVTDYSRFAYLADVFISDSEKGKGFGKLLMKYITERKDLQVDKFILTTKDAHSLYAQFGFVVPIQPERIMEKRKK